MRISQKKGFSLVELSIVLVILGLLTGGILTGQSLIRAAELRSVTTEFQKYQTAVHTFRDKYFYLPGDMPNATRFWGAMTNCGTTNPSGSGMQTCNGDGDGDISRSFPSQTAEIYGFWQHLANSGLIEGSYTGITGSDGNMDSEIGENVPASKLAMAGWSISNSTNPVGTSITFAVNKLNNFEFGRASATGQTYEPVFTPEEAWNIDRKIDDGKPAYGRVTARYWNNLCSFANNGNHANDNLDASYKLSDSSVQCSLIFSEAF